MSVLARFPRRRDALVFVGLAAGALAVSVAAIGGSLAHVNRTFPGFVVWDDLVVVALGRPTWTGIVAGVPFRAHLEGVDGRRVASRGELLDVVRAAPAGTVHAYDFTTSRGAASHQVASMRFGAGDWVATLGVYALNGLVFLAAGLAVFYLKPESPQSRALLAFGVVFGLLLVLCTDLFTAGRLDPLYFVVQGLCPAALVHLALTFPEVRWPLRTSTRPLAWLYAAGLAAGLAEIALYRHAIPALLAVDEAVWLAAAAAGALAMLSVARSALRGETPLARRRARVVLAGAGLAFLVPLAALVAFFVLDVRVSASLMATTALIFPVSIAYAIARHDLFEADRFVKLSLVYAALTALVTLAYAGSVLVAEHLAAGLAFTRSPLFSIGFVLVALGTIVPLRDRVQRGVDRLFYRGRVDYKETVARASERMTTLLERDAIVEHLVTTLRAALAIEGASVWERDGDALVRRGRATEGEVPRIPADHPGFVLVAARRRLLSHDEVVESPRLRAHRAALEDLLRRLGAELLVPLVRHGTVAGVLAVGRKASGGPLSADDIDVLGTLANETAVALANAAAVERLHEARERLSRAERLAAIGELSAAVAHGIRNPLAGIRLAAQLGLESAAPGDAVRENLEDVLLEVDKLEAQVRGILDFARPFEPALEPVDLRTLVESVLATLAGRLTGAGVQVTFSAPPGLPPVLGDAAHLTQALHELLANSLDAMGTGGRLTLEASAAGDGKRRVRLSVVDTGPGVPPESRERVFQLFMTTKATGTGVGLAVVRKIVEQHGGTISLDSPSTGGARFVLELPTAQGAA